MTQGAWGVQAIPRATIAPSFGARSDPPLSAAFAPLSRAGSKKNATLSIVVRSLKSLPVRPIASQDLTLDSKTHSDRKNYRSSLKD